MPTIIAKGIDVSKWQEDIDWNTVKKNVDFAIVRCGYGKNITEQDDPYWFTNADACTKQGIPFGTYLYAHAQTVEGAISEANHVLRLIKGYKLDYPVFYDMEDEDQINLSATLLGDIFEAFATTIKNAGYYPAVYANTNWMKNYLTDIRFNKYDRWVAQFNDTLTWTGAYTMWQYTSSGSVSGISGNVDMNYCYVDYPSIINPKAETPDSGDESIDPEEPAIEKYVNGKISKSNVPYTEPTPGSGKIFPHNCENATFAFVDYGESVYKFSCIQTELESFKTSITK